MQLGSESFLSKNHYQIARQIGHAQIALIALHWVPDTTSQRKLLISTTPATRPTIVLILLLDLLETIPSLLLPNLDVFVDKLCAELYIIDTMKVAHLITKVAYEKEGRERVDIIFDHGVPADEVNPRLEHIAFRSTVSI